MPNSIYAEQTLYTMTIEYGGLEVDQSPITITVVPTASLYSW